MRVEWKAKSFAVRMKCRLLVRKLLILLLVCEWRRERKACTGTQPCQLITTCQSCLCAVIKAKICVPFKEVENENVYFCQQSKSVAERIDNGMTVSWFFPYTNTRVRRCGAPAPPTHFCICSFRSSCAFHSIAGDNHTEHHKKPYGSVIFHLWQLLYLQPQIVGSRRASLAHSKSGYYLTRIVAFSSIEQTNVEKYKWLGLLVVRFSLTINAHSTFYQCSEREKWLNKANW